METRTSPKRQARKQRLAAALKRNLAKRKQQARARAGAKPATPPARPG